MAKSKGEMSPDQKKKCHAVIHTATAAAGASGAIPIPVMDAIPISAAQITMIVSLGKIFGITITKSVAKNILKIGLAVTTGRAIASGLKAIPGVGTIVGGAISATTAAAITQGLGWLVADDFFRMSNGQEPENFTEAFDEIVNLFHDIKNKQ